MDNSAWTRAQPPAHSLIKKTPVGAARDTLALQLIYTSWKVSSFFISSPRFFSRIGKRSVTMRFLPPAGRALITTQNGFYWIPAAARGATSSRGNISSVCNNNNLTTSWCGCPMELLSSPLLLAPPLFLSLWSLLVHKTFYNGQVKLFMNCPCLYDCLGIRWEWKKIKTTSFFFFLFWKTYWKTSWR